MQIVQCLGKMDREGKRQKIKGSESQQKITEI
jgi:hypothetical protein